MPVGSRKSGVVNEQKIWELLALVPDPEIPAISIVELGAVQSVKTDGVQVEVSIMPTYSGCPAIKTFTEDIRKILEENGVINPVIHLVYSPAWTTDRIGDEAREKLRAFGIAPPERGTADKGVLFGGGAKAVPCPRCGSKKTEIVSQFGSTPCKALYSCRECLEPFDYFKCI
jgi:ring-1,2-phenylacetyl-CoA epoxidase subunit PaaD